MYKRSKSTSSSGGGLSVCFLLFVIFLVLKLIGVITWSWWWVTSPLWIGFAIAAIVIVGGIGIALFVGLIALLFAKK